jgi:hypothetical protein
MLLQVTPNLRPSCDKILQYPGVVLRLNSNVLKEVDEKGSL